ncbi:MAG: CGNR zinc finger domain-containing protein [Saprospiraceae bacterium]|jgi:predicted RNA-binding Zn ribbon-like protein|nr:CGNR zinc finger domain-containing protein [Lewinellaceae bacterium]
MENPIATLALDGGWLCLDFINTVSARTPGLGTEYLNNWDDLRAWVRHVGLFSENEWQRWQALPESNIEEVRAFREALYVLFEHLSRKGTLHPKHLDAFNGLLHEVYPHTQLCLTDNGLRRGVSEAPHPEKPLWLIALSAEALLLSDRLTRVKSCGNCGWLFLDTSKNGTRRWCNMQTCGSQMKAKAYYHRKKGQ